MSFLGKLLVVIVLALGLSGALRAQEDALVTVAGVFDARVDRIVFDLTVARTSDRWDRWSNATLRLYVPALVPQGGLDPAKHQIVFEPGTSDLPLQPYNATAMTAYAIVPRIVNGRVSIAILGPDSAGSTLRILTPSPSTIRLGRFVLSTKDGSTLDGTLDWARPEAYYQANAFKMDHDSVTGSGTQRNVWFKANDNVDMVTRYALGPSGPLPCTGLQVADFAADYIGDLSVRLRFSTECEVGTEGFFIERALVRPDEPGVYAFEPRPALDHRNNPSLLSCACKEGRSYQGLLDGVDYRREFYAYRLMSRAQITQEVTAHDTVVVRVPNAIISNTALLDNPFRDRTVVQFNADDRLTLTAAVYDVGGRLITYLTDADGNPLLNKEYPKGVRYRATLDIPSAAAQGLYNIVLIAHPVDDMSIEQESRAVLKAQLLR